MSLYARSAQYYDAIQQASGRNYSHEAFRLNKLIEAHCTSGGDALLDVGCGTGHHLEYLRAWYSPDGLDVDRSMLAVAQARLPELHFISHDMIGFNLDRRYDAIVAIDTIGYVPNVRLLEQTLETFYRHLKPGGVVAIEPWIRPADWKDGYIQARFADEPDLKVARMSLSRRDGNVSILHYNYMVAAPDGVRTFNEPHRLMLFTDEEYRRAISRARLTVEYDPTGLRGRGIYLGIRAR